MTKPVSLLLALLSVFYCGCNEDVRTQNHIIRNQDTIIDQVDQTTRSQNTINRRRKQEASDNRRIADQAKREADQAKKEALEARREAFAAQQEAFEARKAALEAERRADEARRQAFEAERKADQAKTEALQAKEEVKQKTQSSHPVSSGSDYHKDNSPQRAKQYVVVYRCVGIYRLINPALVSRQMAGKLRGWRIPWRGQDVRVGWSVLIYGPQPVWQRTPAMTSRSLAETIKADMQIARLEAYVEER